MTIIDAQATPAMLDDEEVPGLPGADETSVSAEKPRFSGSALWAFVWVSMVTAGVLYAPGAVIFLAIIAALVMVHEGAHLAVARWRGMHCSEFAVGFGPKVAAVQVGEVLVALRLVPAGGFVKITGMAPTEKVDPSLEDRTYRKASLPSKLLTVAAGPVSNLVVAFVLILLAFSVFVPSELRAENPLAEASSFSAMLFTETAAGYGDIAASVGEYPEAVMSKGESGDAPRAMSPVSGSQLAEQATEAGARWLVLFAAIVSLSLGVFNLLPIVPLDGGQATVAIIEAAGSRLTKREFRVPRRLQEGFALSFVGALLLLSAVSVYLDVVAPQANPFQ